MVELKVNYETQAKKRTRAIGLRLTNDELARFNEMASELGYPLSQVIRGLCEAQYKQLKESKVNESKS